jgi:hypothetical protein
MSPGGCAYGGGESFTPTTTVATTSGAVAIAAIKVGDTVMAYDPKTGVTGPHRVSAVMAHTDPAIEHLSTDTGSVDTTPNHPFFTTDRGWVDAGSLKIGEKVRTESGGSATVTGFTVEATPTTMWDLTVDGAHSFFVGAGAVLVHNCFGELVGNGDGSGTFVHAGTSWEVPGHAMQAIEDDGVEDWELADALHSPPFGYVNANGTEMTGYFDNASGVFVATNGDTIVTVIRTNASYVNGLKP